MNALITLLIAAIIFFAVAYAIHWVMVRYGAPQPVMWIVGAILIVILLYFLAGQLGVTPNIGYHPR